MKNIVIISADRCGSTALQQHILGNNLNNDSMVWLGECFNTKMSQNVPYNPEKYPPKSVINSINQGTGKNVIVKNHTASGQPAMFSGPCESVIVKLHDASRKPS